MCGKVAVEVLHELDPRSGELVFAANSYGAH
jgi:hypothetical protein